MSTIQNLTEGMANADALVADQMADVVAADATVEVAVPEVAVPEVDDVAKLKAEMAMLKAKVAAADLAETERTLAAMRAENAKIKAELAAKGKPVTTAAPQVAAKVAAPQVAATQGLLPTDCRLGVIDPKHLNPGDKFLLGLLEQNRTKAEKLTKVGAIPGCLAVKLFHFFGPKGCNFSWDKTNSILAEAMSRNVISKMYFTNSKTGKEMITYFDAQWRPNIKRADDRPSFSDVALAKALFGEATK